LEGPQGQRCRDSADLHGRHVDAAELALEDFAASEIGQRCPAVVPAWRRAWDEFVPFLAARRTTGVLGSMRNGNH
jgi:transposase-like protein